MLLLVGVTLTAIEVEPLILLAYRDGILFLAPVRTCCVGVSGEALPIGIQEHRRLSPWGSPIPMGSQSPEFTGSRERNEHRIGEGPWGGAPRIPYSRLGHVLTWPHLTAGGPCRVPQRKRTQVWWTPKGWPLPLTSSITTVLLIFCFQWEHSVSPVNLNFVGVSVHCY